MTQPTLTGSPRLDRALGQAAERRRDEFNAAVFAARVMARIRALAETAK